MEQGTVTVVIASLGIFGTLCGNFGGLFLSRSWQREQWMRDRRNEEFRELLEALTASMLAANEAMYKPELTAKEREDRKSKRTHFCQVVDTRIFTFDDVKRLDLKDQWLAAVNAHETSRPHDLATFEKTYEELLQRLVEAATAQRAPKM